MTDRAYPQRTRAAQMLVLCCAIWAFSFPITKALQMVATQSVPGVSSVFLSAWCITLRFGAAALILIVIIGRGWGAVRRLEFKQGIGLGIFGGLGILFQVDGLAHTSASISAFLTQFYCVLIPIWFALRDRRWPSRSITIACLLAIIGAGALLGVRWSDFQIGRGEWETLLGSVLFTGQILWLERREFSGNDTLRFSTVMFGTMALICGPASWITAGTSASWRAYANLPSVLLIASLATACTLGSYVLMNHWQHRLPATEAGILYCTEPVFTSLLCLFFPGWLARWVGVDYPNETWTTQMILGGVFILLANVWLQIQPRAPDTHPVGHE